MQAIIETKKIFIKKSFGTGYHQTSIIPDKLHRNPFTSIGGKNSIAGLVATIPIPHNKGTLIAKI